MSTESGFSPTVVTALRKADWRLRGVGRGRSDERYAACRLALARISETDQFYVALYRSDSEIVFPYSVINDQFSAPEVQNYGPRGLSAWIRASRKTYKWSDDNGALFIRGMSMEAEREMRDGFAVPLVDPDNGEALGFFAALSKHNQAFDAEIVHAAEWLARALVNFMRRDEQEADDLALYDLYPELNSARVTDERDLVQVVSERLSTLRMTLGEVVIASEAGDTVVAASTARLATQLCERAQVDTAELLLRHPDEDPRDPFHALTEREREIAELIATENLANAAIASRLFISEKTVKGHVGNILRKLNVSQRSEISWVFNKN